MPGPGEHKNGPRFEGTAPGCKPGVDSVLSVRNLRKWYNVGNNLFGIGKKTFLKAVDDVSFDIERGRTFGLVGESGCGKTTTLKVLLGLEETTEGSIYYEGEDVANMSPAGKKEFRTNVQAVFQDPWSSLNPRMRVGSIVGEPLEIATKQTKAQIKERVGTLLEEVGLNPYQANLYPHEFSGGQRQRIGVARALALNPKVICLDEPVSALDVSIQAQILELLDDIRNQMNLSVLFITHDLRVAAQVCDRLAVMQYGKVVEIGKTADLFNKPSHEYTKALLDAVPGKKWKKDGILYN